MFLTIERSRDGNLNIKLSFYHLEQTSVEYACNSQVKDMHIKPMNLLVGETTEIAWYLKSILHKKS